MNYKTNKKAIEYEKEMKKDKWKKFFIIDPKMN